MVGETPLVRMGRSRQSQPAVDEHQTEESQDERKEVHGGEEEEELITILIRNARRQFAFVY